MAVINRESRCICWAAAIAFFLLSIGLFYYFFVQPSSASNNNATAFNPKSLPTIPIPTSKSAVHRLPFAKEDTEKHSKNLVSLINNHPNRSWVAELNPSAVGLTVLDQAAFVISNDTIDDEIIKTLQDFSEVLKSD
uniref:Uncharacterized protein n=1 Tax=Panagrolaimus sp. ES5 TaxID=591445 RepID=A0AC34FQD9_9BILA